MFTDSRHNFVNLGSLAAALFFVARALAAAPVPVVDAARVQWGLNGHPFSQSGYFDVSLGEQLALVAASGAGWYRVDLSADDFRAGTARLDELVKAAGQCGVRILPVLIASPGARGTGSTPQEIRASAAEFARVVVARYRGRVTHWELSNELDDYALLRKGDTTRGSKRWEWGDPDGSRPEDYEEDRYQRARAEIVGLGEGVRAADPLAKTIVDTAGWLHYGFIERLATEDHVPFDILSWHWYSEMGDMTRVQGSLDLVAYLQRFGRPLWLTEVGRRAGSAGGKERELADFMRADLAKLAVNPGIGALFVYELLDEPYFGEAGESHYGLVTLGRAAAGNWSITGRKEAFGAFASVVRLPSPAPAPSK
jgi:hypothetical protein